MLYVYETVGTVPLARCLPEAVTTNYSSSGNATSHVLLCSAGCVLVAYPAMIMGSVPESGSCRVSVLLCTDL